MNTADFRLVQTLSWSNSSTSSIVVLCCRNLWVACLRCIAGCYFYSQENRLIDMASFWLYYNLNKHTSDWDSIVVLYPASWAIAVVGHLVRMNICGIITSPWTSRQPGHLGSRSNYQAIGTTDRTSPWTSSLMHRVHFFMSTLGFDPPMLLQPDVLPG
jgi:hypothetical protein